MFLEHNLSHFRSTPWRLHCSALVRFNRSDAKVIKRLCVARVSWSKMVEAHVPEELKTAFVGTFVHLPPNLGGVNDTPSGSHYMVFTCDDPLTLA